MTITVHFIEIRNVEFQIILENYVICFIIEIFGYKKIFVHLLNPS
jgi:hypothetical protein